jgi:signal recognition particle subunit SRP54
VFENLSQRLEGILNKLKSRGKLSEKDVEQALREVRLALLEADVNFKVVKDFTSRVRERAIGAEVMKSLTPGQQVIKIVSEELTSLMGSTESRVILSPKPPTIIMLVGLQGSGKTTAAAKLAYFLRKEGHKPYLVAADIYRPAAVEQLKVLADENEILVYIAEDKDSVEIAKEGIKAAKDAVADVVIIDTAGRLHIDEEMMTELVHMKEVIKPHQILLVVDAMTGQDAVNVATTFQKKLNFDGIIMTKLDGDARGGAALSIKAVTGRPIKLVSVGEKIDSLEIFHPDRMASRILGMGDVLTLIEKAQETVDAERARELEQKFRRMEFTLEDFLHQLEEMKKLGPIENILNLIPGFGKVAKNIKVTDKDMVRVKAIIQSMTPEERRKPSIITGSRRQRIAKGSGTTAQEVNQLLKQFHQTKKLLKQFSNVKGRLKLAKDIFPFLG